VDRPWGPTSLLYNGYRVIPGDKVARVVLATHPPTPNTEAKERVQVYVYSPSVTIWQIIG